MPLTDLEPLVFMNWAPAYATFLLTRPVYLLICGAALRINGASRKQVARWSRQQAGKNGLRTLLRGLRDLMCDWRAWLAARNANSGSPAEHRP